MRASIMHWSIRAQRSSTRACAPSTKGRNCVRASWTVCTSSLSFAGVSALGKESFGGRKMWRMRKCKPSRRSAVPAMLSDRQTGDKSRCDASSSAESWQSSLQERNTTTKGCRGSRSDTCSLVGAAHLSGSWSVGSQRGRTTSPLGIFLFLARGTSVPRRISDGPRCFCNVDVVWQKLLAIGRITVMCLSRRKALWHGGGGPGHFRRWPLHSAR